MAKASSSLQRMTRQRRILMEVMDRANWHPTAEEIYNVVRERAPRISLGTVYRNLDVLSREGMIMKIEETGGQRRYDGNPKPHFHVFCLKCGVVRDLHENDINWDGPPEATCPGFTITGFKLVFEGYCSACLD
ncbi:MAG TPA: transcriptional repressor [Candidatus Hydrogenedentes bacterium]|nr:transcriptional repressor [Candidatus Hydrogenedentota bacterium]